MELQGKIKLIGETKTYGSNNFRKREIVITTEGEYPQPISIEFIQDKCDVLNTFKVGSEVEIGINIRGREWTDKEGNARYFNSIQGWRIKLLSDIVPSVPQPQLDVNDDTDDCLPF